MFHFIHAPRLLSFPALKLPLEESSKDDKNQKPQSEDDGLNSEKKLGLSEPDSGNKKDDDFKCEHEMKLHLSKEEPNGTPMTLETILAKKDALSTGQNPDNIARRLTQEHGKDISHNNGNGIVNHVVSKKKVVKDRETHNAEEDIVEGYNASESSPKLMKRLVSTMRCSPDIIAERLKQRRRQGSDHDEEDVVSKKKVVKERRRRGWEIKGNFMKEMFRFWVFLQGKSVFEIT
ncbi:hypothetical protein PTKIN_Ptkin01aG0008400 [Pterospermum kingtungense]